MNAAILCLDLGGTNARLGLVSIDGRVLQRRRWKMSPPGNADSLYDYLGNRIVRFMSGVGTGSRPAAVVIGFAGPTWSAGGYVYCSPNIGQLAGLNIGPELSQRLSMPVLVANDANCAALGEYWRGAGAGTGSMFLFTIGTGVGGGLVADGELWEGSAGIAGEVGHTVVAIDGPMCTCGSRGCLEALVSATAIVRAYRKVLPGGLDHGVPITAKMIFARARHGDAAARAVIARAGKALGVGIANVYHLLNPEVIVIGGGVGRAGRLLIAPAVEMARGLVFGPLRDRLRVSRAKLGDDAALIGGAYLASRKLGL
jgi:glucokinase